MNAGIVTHAVDDTDGVPVRLGIDTHVVEDVLGVLVVVD